MKTSQAFTLVALIEVVLLLIVVVGGAIVLAVTDKLTWDEYLRDVMILAGALGIGTGIAAGAAVATNQHNGKGDKRE